MAGPEKGQTKRPSKDQVRSNGYGAYSPVHTGFLGMEKERPCSVGFKLCFRSSAWAVTDTRIYYACGNYLYFKNKPVRIENRALPLFLLYFSLLALYICFGGRTAGYVKGGRHPLGEFKENTMAFEYGMEKGWRHSG